MVEIKKRLYDDIKAYCEINDIPDRDAFINNLLEKAFTGIKYGEKPNIIVKKESNIVKVEEKIEPQIEPAVNEIKKVITQKKENIDNYDGIYDE
jgi:hypothetical protein